MLILRVGKLAPQLPGIIHAQNQILARGLDTARAAMLRHGVALAPPPHKGDDPLTWRRALLQAADDTVSELHERSEEPWAPGVLRTFRLELAAMSEVEAQAMRAVLDSGSPPLDGGASRSYKETPPSTTRAWPVT